MKRYFAVFLLALAVVACQKSEDPNPIDPVPVELSLTADKLMSNGVIQLQVTITKGKPDKLELIVNNVVEANLTEPYSYSFNPDNKQKPEDSYSVYVKAQTGTKTSQSNRLELTIDYTSPVVMNRSPEADSSARVTDSIEIIFSELIDPLSVSENSVEIYDIRQGLLKTSSKLTATKLELNLEEQPLVPSGLRLELKGIRDLAGNSLSESWSWAIPNEKPLTEFVLLGERSISLDKTLKESPSRVAADDAGHIALVYVDGKTVKVKTWNGSDWQLLSDIVNSKEAYSPDVALLNDGKPVIVWQDGTETDPGQGDIQVRAWNGDSWDDLGTVDTADNDAAAPVIAIDKNNTIFVAWFEFDGSSSNVLVKKHDGLGWQALAGALDLELERLAAYPSLALDNQGKPFVAWFEARSTDPDDKARHLYVKAWNETDWELLGEELNINSFEAVTLFSLAVGGNGRPVVAWSEFANLEESNNIYVKTWTGSTWQRVGDVADFKRSQRAIYPTIVADSANVLSLAWWEGKTAEGSTTVIENDIYFAQWNGSSWQQFGEMEALEESEGRYPDLALAGSAQMPVLTWSENTSSIYVKLAR